MDDLIGWDIGGAHLKACRVRGGQVLSVAQWPCPLWQGLRRLREALALARGRWPDLAELRHVVTMSGELADCFADRRQGVLAITETLVEVLVDPADALAAGASARLALFCRSGHWCAPVEAAARWAEIASANWLAPALWAARRLAAEVADAQADAGAGLLVDIGSTTTDFVPLRAGAVLARGGDDGQRLQNGELLYHGVVRTPLCALAPRVQWRGRPCNVMHEFFATTADVYRVSGELCAAHDQQPAADGGAKTLAATHARLARMIGRDAADASAVEWRALALQWRGMQVDALAAQLHAVVQALPEALPGGAVASVIALGCGSFLLPDVLRAAGYTHWRRRRWSGDLVPLLPDAGAAAVAAWADVCAPAVAVALLAAQPAAREDRDRPTRVDSAAISQRSLPCGS